MCCAFEAGKERAPRVGWDILKCSFGNLLTIQMADLW
jgi:hypothetical protein